MAYELAIFDFDDTILHLDVDWPSVRKEMLSLAAKKRLDVEPDLHLAVMANDLSKAGLKERIDSIFLEYESMCAKKRAYEVFPPMVSFIEEIGAAGIRLAIASGNHTESIKAILTQLDLLESFELICGRDLVQGNKPDPDQLLYIMERLGVPKNKAIFAGDSRNDEAAASSAGILYVKVDPSDTSGGIERLRALLL
ncbi:MAG: HAD family hydrolase [Candidatus Micrarchaeota archaeon]